VQAWEAGLSYPSVEHLRALIACFLECGAFAAGSEKEEATALCELVRVRTPRRMPLFEGTWFHTLRATTAADVVEGTEAPRCLARRRG
jgi:hypothetical protein